MRRNARQRNNDTIFKNFMFWSGSILLLAVIAFGITYAIYSNKVKNEARVSKLNSRSIGELVPSLQIENEDIQSASVQIGKKVNEVQENIENDILENNEEEVIENKLETESVQKQTEVDEPKQTQDLKKDLSFKMPVEGEIIKEFAKENLVYSETLKEWITHNGIDIKADKTSVVKAAEEGTVKSIKNDPRYGITVTIEHKDGFKTIYANLLTAEFISEGEHVKQGQTIGTVGTSANFEVADEPHLHFEIWKDGEAVDPKIYLK